MAAAPTLAGGLAGADIGFMTAAPPLVLFAVLLAGCGAGGGAGRVADDRPNPIGPIYVRSDEAPQDPGAAPQPAPVQAGPGTAPAQPRSPESPPPRRRGGGSIPSPFGDSPTRPPVAVAPPLPPSSTDATARFKRDLLAPRVQDLRDQDALGRLGPQGRRDLLMRELDLHRLETDPLRR